MVDQQLVPELLQRLLTRLDHIEFGVLRHQQVESQVAKQDLHELSEQVSNMERARLGGAGHSAGRRSRVSPAPGSNEP